MQGLGYREAIHRHAPAASRDRCGTLLPVRAETGRSTHNDSPLAGCEPT